MQVFDVRNHLQKFIAEYAQKRGIKYSAAVKELAVTVGVNYRHIYALVNGNSKASIKTQFAICKFFGARVEEVFSPVILEEKADMVKGPKNFETEESN